MAASAHRKTSVNPHRILRTLSLQLWKWRTLWAIFGISLVLLGTSALGGPPHTPDTTIFVTSSDLPTGTVVSSQDIEQRDVAANLELLGGPATRSEIEGAVLSVPLSAGTLIRTSDLVSISLFAGVPDGLVFTVVTIENDGIISYLQPGMRVDLLAPDPQPMGVTSPADSAPSASALAQGAIIVSIGGYGAAQHGDFNTLETVGGTPWAESVNDNEFSSTVLVATTPEQSKALALGSHWQGVHAIIVQ